MPSIERSKVQEALNNEIKRAVADLEGIGASVTRGVPLVLKYIQDSANNLVGHENDPDYDELVSLAVDSAAAYAAIQSIETGDAVDSAATKAFESVVSSVMRIGVAVISQS